MVPRRVLQAFIVLTLGLACGLIPGAPQAPLPTITPAVTEELALAQISFVSSVYLRYDPQEWEAFHEFQDQQNRKGEPIESLRHRDIPGCVLHDNLGRGAPPAWEREDTDRMIGSLEYRVEAWTDTETQKPVLIVYQYPVGESGYGTRIELVIDQYPERCIQSAEDVLSLSSDLISGRQ